MLRGLSAFSLSAHLPSLYLDYISAYSAGFGWNFDSMDYGEDWRVCRRMARLDFHSASFAKYRPTLRKHAHEFVRRLGEEHGARLPVHLKQ